MMQLQKEVLPPRPAPTQPCGAVATQKLSREIWAVTALIVFFGLIARFMGASS